MKDSFPTVSELLERLQDGETSSIEAKASHQKLSQDVWSTVSAFANTGGGFIILGIGENEDGSFFRKGVLNAAQQVSVFFKQHNNRQKLSRALCQDRDVTQVDEGALSFIIIRVPAASRKERPVYINGDPFRGTYRRQHDGDYRCSEEEVRIMMREGAEQAPDEAILEHYGLDTLDLEAVRDYRGLYFIRNPNSPYHRENELAFLTDLGCYEASPERNIEGITVAGLLLFGKQRFIRKWRGRHLIDYRFRENPDQERWDNRIVWESHLYGAYRNISQELVRGLPVPFSMDHDGNRAHTTPEREALLEALVNLLVHADYHERHVSLVLREPDGYVFDNPGSSRVLDLSGAGAKFSDPRNPTILKAFRYIGWADEAGSGIKKIRKAWKSLGLTAPVINSDASEYRFELRLRHAHMLSDDERSWITSISGIQKDEIHVVALIEALRNERIDNATLSRLVGCHPTDATKALIYLREVGFLEKEGAGRGTWYHLPTHVIKVYDAFAQLNRQNEAINKLKAKGLPIPESLLHAHRRPIILPTNHTDKAEPVPQSDDKDLSNVGSPSQTLESGGQIIESPPQIIESGGQIIESPPQIMETEGQIIESPSQTLESGGQIIESPAENAASSRKLLEELGVELDEKGQIVGLVDDPLKELVMRLTKVGGKASRTEMEQLILLLCARAPYTAEEIAQRAGRTLNYLQQSYLAPLVKSKKLELLKQTKAHPKLRYITVLKNTDD